MQILLIAATEFEVQPFLKYLSSHKKNNVEFLICGVGIPSTVFHLTKKLSEKNYNLVIQAGIGGTFTKKIKRGEVVAVTQDTFGDIGVQEKKIFKTHFEIGLSSENEFPFEKGWLVNTNKILTITHLKKVTSVTINKLSDKKVQTKLLHKLFKADVESMEGAAFHYVCLQKKIPFLQLRAISNKVGERNKKKWKMNEAITALNEELIRLINTII